MAKLIFGCGYLGERVAQRWRAAGETVYVVTRSAERAETLRAAGYSPIVADVTERATLVGLPVVETVLFAVGIDRGAGKTIKQVYVEGLANVLAALPTNVRRLIYISSTGVYGDSAGEWVDERTPCAPRREGGRACVAAEELLAAPPWGARAIVLRLAGIYGPGRIPLAKLLTAGEPIPAPPDGFLNLIHVNDAADLVLAVESQVQPPRTYCVSDGQPAVRRAYYEELARLLKAPPPVFVVPPADSPAARRAEADKRISNKRVLAEVDVTLRFPSYHEGLAAIVAAET